MSQWHNCYGVGWRDEITPESFSHPAKFSRALIRRIYEHAFENGWLKQNETVIDPFGGVALGGLDAAIRGVQWIGCELEPRFASLGNQNIDLWQSRYGSLAKWRRPVLLNGDSRKIATIIREQAAACISSPPYADGLGHGGTPTRGKGRTDDLVLDSMQNGYGTTAGQLATLSEGSVDAAVSSPPFEAASTGGGISAAMRGEGNYNVTTKLPRNCYQPTEQGILPENLANESGETFWAASRTILEQVHLMLKPGAHAIFVLKDFVRAKKIAPFCDNWRRLCEAVGFRTVCQHQAMLVEHGQPQGLLDGGEHVRTKERKSFFRRLAEKHGSPKIDWETVLCMEKTQL